jgi:hypothetical protein
MYREMPFNGKQDCWRGEVEVLAAADLCGFMVI